ncbi:aconitase X swivel domain-containing protein [Mesorhizobium cantuariense]|uniref:Aconitase X swivel domain-containing protein n=1 Tax=Mesorhizobium cantuariense TaxID=1300275 RepID=A0ABV7MS73_9HYPH
MTRPVERTGTFQLAGEAEGQALVFSQPLSFWGGVDAETGDITDHSHPGLGQNVAGRILVMPSGRGSSSSSSVLAEAIRRGTAPAGILLERPDPILAVGAIVAEFLYEIRMPLVVCDIAGIASGDGIMIGVGEDGAVTVRIQPAINPAAPRRQ